MKMDLKSRAFLVSRIRGEANNEPGWAKGQSKGVG